MTVNEQSRIDFEAAPSSNRIIATKSAGEERLQCGVSSWRTTIGTKPTSIPFGGLTNSLRSPQPYYGLTSGLSFVRNKFILYNQGGDNPAITAWRARQGYGTRWQPGAD